MIRRKAEGKAPLAFLPDEAFEYDVQRRVQATGKAERVLGFEAATSVDEMLGEVIPWITDAVANVTL